MEIGNTFIGIHHCQGRTGVIASLDILRNFLFLFIWQGFNLVQDSAETVIGVHTKLSKCCAVFFKHITEED